MNYKYLVDAKGLAILRIFLGMVLIVVVSSACRGALSTQESPAVVPTSTPTPNIQPTQTLSVMEQYPMEWAALKNGPHAAAYDLSKGPNTYCAKCHSPANWDPQAVIDDPPNCVSCKFPNEADVRVAEGNELIPEEEWGGIDCGTCHQIRDGKLSTEPKWHDRQTGFDESVGTTKELCEKCHTNTESLSHKRDLGEETHIGFTCTTCHNPHSLQASCTQSGCHLIGGGGSPFPANHPPMAFASCGQDGCHTGTNSSTNSGQNSTGEIGWDHTDRHHTAVTCLACHDASGLPVKLLEDQNIWVVFRTVELLGYASEDVYQSHAITKNVNCSRCHYIDNPWGLSDNVQDNLD